MHTSSMNLLMVLGKPDGLSLSPSVQCKDNNTGLPYKVVVTIAVRYFM